jgi:predicted amidohydrolase YtcJ
MTMDTLKTSLVEAHALGLQLAIHGVGDKANHELTDLGIKGCRARIEDAQHLSDDAVQRIAALEVGALADLVVLSDNICDIAVEDIIAASVTMTIVGGQVMYQWD